MAFRRGEAKTKRMPILDRKTARYPYSFAYETIDLEEKALWNMSMLSLLLTEKN